MSKLKDTLVRPRATQPVVAASLISWQSTQPGLWTGQIGLDFAGLIEASDDSFLVTDWSGEQIGVFSTLDEAMRELEPSERARRRDEADRLALRLNIVLTCGIAAATVGAASIFGAWLTAAM